MKLYMKQKVFSWTDKFTIKDEYGRDCYYVEGQLLSIGKKLRVYDAEHREVAFIHEKVLSLFGRYIVDIDGREVCQIVRKFALLRQKYALEGIPWRVKGDFWAHDYTVWDGEREVMHLSKHWFSWGDSYELDIVQPQDALLCLCVALAVDAAIQGDNTASTSAST